MMIGKFESTQDAKRANDLLQKLMEQARTDEQGGIIDSQGETDRFSEAMSKLLSGAKLVHSCAIGAATVQLPLRCRRGREQHSGKDR